MPMKTAEELARRIWSETEGVLEEVIRAIQKGAFEAGKREGLSEGFSLGTEAAAKAIEAEPDYSDLPTRNRIRELRYEDVKGEP